MDFRIRTTLLLLLVLVVFNTLPLKCQARGGVYSLEPLEEFTETVELKMGVNVSGNLFADRVVGFYVTDPNDMLLLRINSTTDSKFNFTRTVKGDYIMHIVNPSDNVSVNVTLDYGIEFLFEASVNMGVGASAGVAHVAAPLIWGPPIDDDSTELWDIAFRQAQRVYIIGADACRLLRDLTSVLRNGMPLLLIGCIIGLLVLFPTPRHKF